MSGTYSAQLRELERVNAELELKVRLQGLDIQHLSSELEKRDAELLAVTSEKRKLESQLRDHEQLEEDIDSWVYEVQDEVADLQAKISDLNTQLDKVKTENELLRRSRQYENVLSSAQSRESLRLTIRGSSTPVRLPLRSRDGGYTWNSHASPTRSSEIELFNAKYTESEEEDEENSTSIFSYQNESSIVSDIDQRPPLSTVYLPPTIGSYKVKAKAVVSVSAPIIATTGTLTSGASLGSAKNSEGLEQSGKSSLYQFLHKDKRTRQASEPSSTTHSRLVSFTK